MTVYIVGMDVAELVGKALRDALGEFYEAGGIVVDKVWWENDRLIVEGYGFPPELADASPR